MKKSKIHLELHSESGSHDLAYLVLLAMAHVLHLTCATMIVAQLAETVNVLSMFKLLIIGEIVIAIVLVWPISFAFSKNEQSKIITGTRIKGHKSDLSKSSAKLWTIINGLALYISSIALFHFISILFGAPLIKDIDRTFHFATLLSSTSILPTIIVLGCCQDEWIRVFIHHETNNVLEFIVKLTSISSIVGAWLGAFPIPLDWDRPWQVWPISCVLGTMTGFCCGLFGGIAYLQYHKMRYGKKAT